MANQTALTLVNDVLKKSHLIAGDAGALTSFTDSARQNWIDNILLAANETIDELYRAAGMMLPERISEATITLVTGTRSYSFTGSDLFWPLADETNGRYIYEYSGGYAQIIKDQPVPTNFTGLPSYGCINPTNGQIYLDREPTASENGLAYKYRAEADGVLSAITDTVPFSDKVYRSILPAITEMFNYYDKREFAEGLYMQSMARAGQLLTKQAPRQRWGPERASGGSQLYSGIAFPFEE